MSLLDDPEHWLTVFQDESPEGLSFSKVLGQGKSAVVFEATNREGSSVAVKVYDADRLAKYGLEVQQERIARELSLVGHHCIDLVKVYSGGNLEAGTKTFPYVELELIDGEDLRDRVSAGRLTDPEVRRHLRSLARAAAFLDSRGLCHRDIKVDNCRLRADGSLVLLDLGVLRPISASDLTDTVDDPKARYFLGTLRYAPPEFLLRREGDTPNDWRAVSLYQIGGVLYEMIHGVQLFSHVREPYAELVQAVLQAKPTVMRQDVGQDLITLTRNCLVKAPTERLRLVPWDSLVPISETVFSAPPQGPDLASRMRQAAEHYSGTVEAKQEQSRREAELRRETQQQMVALVSKALTLSVLADVGAKVLSARRTVVVKIQENLKFRFPHAAWLCCRIRISDDSLETAQVDGALFFGNFDVLEASGPNQFASRKNQDQIPPGLSKVLDDHQFKSHLTTISHEPPEESIVGPKVRAWAEQSLECYFDVTTRDWEAGVEEEQKRIGARSWMSFRNSRLFVIKDGQAIEVKVARHR